MINILNKFVINSIKMTYFKKKCQKSVNSGWSLTLNKAFLFI